MDVLNEFLIELVAFHCFRFAQYHQLHAGTGDGYVHSSQVIQETYLSVFIGTDQADENDITFLSLEAVYGVLTVSRLR